MARGTYLIARVTALAALLALGFNCTGRAQDRQPFKFGKADLQLLDESNAIDRQLEARGLVFHDPVLEKRIADIFEPLRPKEPVDRVEWHVRVLRDPTVNALALPNGSVYVNTGLIAVAESDDELAVALAYEITHVVKRHAYLLNRSLRKKTIALEAVYAASTWQTSLFGTAAIVGLRNFATLYCTDYSRGYGEQLEREADLEVLHVYERSGREAGQIIRFFQLMDQRAEPEPPTSFWPGHSKAVQRIENLKKALKVAGQPAARPRDSDYAVRMRPILLQNIRLDLESRRFRSAAAAAQRLADARPDDAEAAYWLGESYRRLGPRKPVLELSDLADHANRKAYNEMMRQTEQEETDRLSKTPGGRARLESSQRKAEELYLRAAALDPSLAKPQLGLGLLYEQRGRRDQALAAYMRYLAVAPDAEDRERVERRIAGLNSEGGRPR